MYKLYRSVGALPRDIFSLFFFFHSLGSSLSFGILLVFGTSFQDIGLHYEADEGGRRPHATRTWCCPCM